MWIDFNNSFIIAFKDVTAEDSGKPYHLKSNLAKFENLAVTLFIH